MSPRPGTVVKVGGSLFDLPDLAARLRDWLVKHDLPRPIVFLAGLGPLGDTIRTWQKRFGWSDEQSHALCLSLLDVSAQTLAGLLPEIPLVADLPSFADERTPPAMIFQPASWLRQQEPSFAGTPLTRNWETTTDSIAARLANVLFAGELVLLKSTLPPDCAADCEQVLQSWCEHGIVDPQFAIAARGLPVIAIHNLRDTGSPAVVRLS